MPSDYKPYILGLDLGAGSVGWALLRADKTKSPKPVGIERCGVRIFQSGVEGDFESGNTESRNLKRRLARQARRILDRRARRKAKLFNLLVQAGLLPHHQDIENLSLRIDTTIKQVDAELLKSWAERFGMESACSKLPYLIRRSGLDEKLAPYEIGRALYHIGQRRGFLSNRKASSKDNDEGVIKKSTAELQEQIDQSGCRTLGEYLAALDPREKRIRQRYTLRSMYENEFELLWGAQQSFYPELMTEELKQACHTAIFYQRPLKSVAHLIGPCEFEKKRKRAPWAILDAQSFRMLQQVNHTTVIESTGELRPLTADERIILIDLLETHGDQTFTAAKRALGLPRNFRFNFEEGGESRFLGNRTNSKLRQIFGERWDIFEQTQKIAIIEDCLTIANEAALDRRAKGTWGLDDDQAQALVDVKLDSGYCALSRIALKKILPYLEEGESYIGSVNRAYPERLRPKILEKLPPVAAVMPQLRNPVVARTLAELRKIVNRIVATYGKPAAIRLEMARDMRKSQRQRQESTKRNRQRERQRSKVADKLLKECGIQRPSRRDIEKALLWEECNGQCPYTGKQIAICDLFGSAPKFDIEHIIPFSRCLDNSFANKTLCCLDANRRIKQKKTPWEAYGGNPTKWAEIVERVGKFKGDLAKAKLERFAMREAEEWEGFVNRQLNDTRYASRLAVEYLAPLYGGVVDADGSIRIQPGRGGITAFVRGVWGLNRILGSDGRKSRDDHRHHAIDAIAIALTEPKTFQMLKDAAGRAQQERRHLFGHVTPPWPNMFAETKACIEQLVISHRPARKVSGPLHKKTLYGKPRTDKNGKTYVTVRKIIDDKISASDLHKIIDDSVRTAIFKKIIETGGNPEKLTSAMIKKAFSDSNAPPMIIGKKDKSTPIYKARVAKSDKTITIGNGARVRQVITMANSHIEIFSVRQPKGNGRWEGRLVSRYEAMHRLRTKQPIVDRHHESGTFVCSLAPGDMITVVENGYQGLYRVTCVSIDRQGSREYPIVKYVSHKDARKMKVIEKEKEHFKKPLEKLRKKQCRKVIVSAFGKIRYSND